MSAEPSELSHIEHSGSMELLIESAFLSELLQEAWFGRGKVIDVLHSTVDAFGYDVVLQCGEVIRHVQLKAKKHGSRTSKYAISAKLGQQPAGCVVCIVWQPVEGNRVELGYYWFGNSPGQPLGDLGDRVSRHSRANAQGVKAARPNMRDIKFTEFTRLAGVGELLDSLFGPAGAADD